MRWSHVLPGLFKHLLTSAACCALAAGTAHGQAQLTSGFGSHRGTVVPCPAPCERLPAPTPAPSATTTPPPPPTTTPAPSPTADSSLTAGAFAAESGPAVGGESFSTAAGYIDSAIPVSQFRLRYDSMYNTNRPDRAEFFYPKCGCFNDPSAGTLRDPNAKGPPAPGETRIDYQELRAYLEWAVDRRFSAFVEVPQRWINPDVNVNAEGFGDVNFGFKYAFLYSTDRVATFQFRTQAPTGQPGLGLGTNNWWVQPGLLVYQKLADRLFLEAELSDYIPFANGSDFAGNVLRYGAGLNYQVYNTTNFRVAPVVELVGWTVLSGKETVFEDPNMIRDASGDTIVNAKAGVRVGFGDLVEPGMLSRSDLYIGYGRALTGEVWYKDMFRIEYRMRF